MNLEAWAYMLQKIGCGKSRNEIVNIIKHDCLQSPHKVNGAYVIDGAKVWERLVENDIHCLRGAENENIYDYISLESWYEQIQYKEMWHSYRSAYKKPKR